MRDSRFPSSHRIGLYMRVDDGPEILVGTALCGQDVPRLLNAIAGEWDKKVHVEVDNAHYFATEVTDTWSTEP